ncbi:cNMP binding protein [Oryctes borbonicus]|uniref:cNMP binding protein n=1 Tax=Oryctes borbonicus TaxID=1629725 RepID=A0A0T6B6X2_9SCAR|nr:cNMP binding protein [Oryctes borbonicus]
MIGDTIAVNVEIPENTAGDNFYVCVKPQNTSDRFSHQGSETWLSITTHGYLLPPWVAIIVIVVCLSFSALFSGLNLGLMSMDMTELKILCNTGTPTERKYAKKIRPIRKHGNYLLCSILLGNVLVNSIFTILLDGLTSGLIAVIFSTIAIVLFGEISPQAVCSRHGLAVGANTINITKLVMVLTAPLSYPVSKILDWILGEEIGNVYNRERLKELVKIQYSKNVTTGENDLDKDEVNIISGALELRKKTVAEVMTRIEDAFMLDYDAVLDFETVSEIMKSGYSRIPVYEGDRKKIITTLYIKDLAFVDPDDNTPLKTLCQFYQNPCNFVFEDVTLDVMFKEFKEGNKGHMAFVHRVNSEGEGDPFYETIGLITLEDVIEELIQAEIMDETDVVTDNRTRRKRTAHRTKQDFTFFADRKGESNRIRISPQLTLATFQYLSTSVELFKPSNISETILRRLLKQDIIYHIKRNKDWRNDPLTIIYHQGKAADYFVLVLEGRVEVTVGQEHLIFESGPFTYFGTQALVQNVGVVAETPTTIGSLQSLNMDTLLRYTFQPDYTVRACTELLYLKVKRSLYLAAKKASLMEFSQKDTNAATGEFDAEVEKLLHSLGEEDSLGRSTPDPKHSTPPQYTQHNEPPQSPHVASPKAHSNALSPTNGSRSGARSANGRLKVHQNLTMDDTHASTVSRGKEEEVSLLPKNS